MKKGSNEVVFFFFFTSSFIIYFSWAAEDFFFLPSATLVSALIRVSAAHSPCFNCLWSPHTANIMITRGNRDYFPCFPCTASRLTQSILMKENGRTAPPEADELHNMTPPQRRGVWRERWGTWQTDKEDDIRFFCIHVLLLFYFPSSVGQRGVCRVAGEVLRQA